MDAHARDRPRFKASIQPVVVTDDGLFLLWDGGEKWFSNAIFADLAQLLDGTNSIDVIFDRLAGQHRSATVFAALKEFERLGVLAEDSVDLPQSVRVFWEQAGVPPGQVVDRQAAAAINLVTLGDVPSDAVASALVEMGLSLSAEGSHAVVVTDDYLDPGLAELNERFLDSRQPWLLVKPTGTETWIGPAISPHDSACWECLAQRLRWHRRVARYAATRSSAAQDIKRGYLPSTLQACLAEAATGMVRWIARPSSSPLQNCVISTNTVTHERHVHRLIRRPQCPACGTRPPTSQMPEPVTLRPRPKVETAGGGHRASDPEETAQRLNRHLSPITGVIGVLEAGNRTEAATEEGRWLTPTYSADHNFSDMHDARFVLRDGMRRRSGGKGKTTAQARASALAESLERYSAVFDGTEPRIRAQFTDLDRAAIEPNACMHYSARQFADRELHNGKEHKAHWVPEPFDPAAEIEWSPLWSLTEERHRYLPTSMCYFGYRSEDPVFGRADSNGCAVGSTREEAILQGLLELVERDAVAIWWYNRVQRPGVDLATSNDPYVADLVDHYATLGRNLWALNLTGDLGIPTFAALSKRTDKEAEDIIYGFGCHLDPRVALLRAVTEVNQSLEAVPALARPETELSYLGTEEAVRWWREVRTAEHDYLVPKAKMPPLDMGAIRDLASNDLAQDVMFCVERLKAHDVEVLVLDQSRPDIDFPAVKVVAPGLRHFWARYGPGRLYDVPVKLGWLDRPKSETDLNMEVVQF